MLGSAEGSGMRCRIFCEMAIFGTLALTILGWGLLGCDSSENSGEDPASQVVRIVSPIAGQSFKVYDTVQIVVESDYSKFGGGVSVVYSPDSSKHWYLIHSFSRKPGLARDTIRWNAQESGDVADGSVILLQAYDYDRDFIMTLAEGIRFSD